MKSTRLLSLAGLFIGGAILLAACGSDDAEVVPTPVFEPTAAPAGQTPSGGTSATAAPVSTAAPVAMVGNAADGEAAFGVAGCSGCHSTGDNRVVGPGLAGVGDTAAERVAGESADEYLTNAILSPSKPVWMLDR